MNFEEAIETRNRLYKEYLIAERGELAKTLHEISADWNYNLVKWDDITVDSKWKLYWYLKAGQILKLKGQDAR